MIEIIQVLTLPIFG